ncbi:MAG: HAD family hydrolase [Microcoleaceae cyanobacterium]
MTTLKIGNLTFHQIAAILFDKDGTLEDSYDFLIQLAQARSRQIDQEVRVAGNLLLEAFGVQENWLDIAGLMAVGSRHENEMAAATCMVLMGYPWSTARATARRAFAAADQELQFFSGSPLVAGGPAVLDSLSTSGLKLGVLSAALPQSVHQFVTRHRLERYFQLQMGVDGDLTKPDPRLFLVACERLGVDPTTTLMVGDSISDMEMARQANSAGCIGVSYRGRNPSLAAVADVVITELNQIQLIDSD